MKAINYPMTHYAGFIVLYLLLVILLPANKIAMNTYHLNSFKYHLLLLLVVLPFIGIWFAAFYGFSKLQKYALSIRSATEGRDFHHLAAGSGWLAYALPLSAILSIVLNSLTNHYAGFHAAAVIINNYVGLLLPLVAFTLYSNSARNLSTRSNIRLSLQAGRLLIFVFATLGVFYCYFTFRNLGVGSLTSTSNAFFLPAWLAVTTIVMPYLYIWFNGLLAAYEITLFAKKVTGVLYRQALRLVSLGIATIIISSIASQYLTSITPRSGSLGLNYVLILIFIIELLMAGGYSFIAFGAQRLQRIEDV